MQDGTHGAKQGRTEATNKSVLRSANETVETREREISFCCAGRTLTHFIRYYSLWVFARAAVDLRSFSSWCFATFPLLRARFLHIVWKYHKWMKRGTTHLYNPCYRIWKLVDYYNDISECRSYSSITSRALNIIILVALYYTTCSCTFISIDFILISIRRLNNLWLASNRKSKSADCE